jgi:hypothetical protein
VAVRAVAIFLFLAAAISFLTGSSLLLPQMAWHGCGRGADLIGIGEIR